MSYKEWKLQQDLCRCCHSEGSFPYLSCKSGNEEIYSDMLRFTLDIHLAPVLGPLCTVTYTICEPCILKLREATIFKKQVLRCEEMFRNLCTRNVVKVADPADVKIKQESPNANENNQEDIPYMDNDDVHMKTDESDRKDDVDDNNKGASQRYRVVKIRKPIKSMLALRFNNDEKLDEVNKEPTVAPTETVKNRTNLRNILQYSNATPIKYKDSLGYRCMYCHRQFQEPVNLKQHTLKEHNDDQLIRSMTDRVHEKAIKLDITMLNCALCDKDFDKLNDLIVHLKSEHNKQTYSEVKNWILPFTFTSSELRCSICDVIFTSFRTLLEHMHVHYPNYPCEVCGAAYATAALLKNHSKCHSDRKYKCDKCEKSFATADYRTLHFRRIHLGLAKRNVCKVCYERFDSYWKKVDHMVKEHGMPPVVLKCQACDRTFNNQKSLSTHVKKDHLLERKHKCTECDMKFYSKALLRHHMTKHTGLRKYQCDVCLKMFGQKSTLREHLRIHANDRRFACVHCGQTFVQKCSWKGHMRNKHAEIVT